MDIACFQFSVLNFQFYLSFSPLESIAEAEDACSSESCDDMPDTPPCGDDEHTTILQFGRKDVGVEQKDEAEA